MCERFRIHAWTAGTSVRADGASRPNCSWEHGPHERPPNLFQWRERTISIDVMQNPSFLRSGALRMNTVPRLVNELRYDWFRAMFGNAPGHAWSASTSSLVVRFACLANRSAYVCPVDSFVPRTKVDASALRLHLTRHFCMLHGSNDPKRVQP